MVDMVHLSILDYNTGGATGAKITIPADKISYVADGAAYGKAAGTAVVMVKGDASHPGWLVNADASAVAAAAGGMYQIAMYGMPTFMPWIKLAAITAVYPARADGAHYPADLFFVIGEGFTPVGVKQDDVPALVAAAGPLVVL